METFKILTDREKLDKHVFFQFAPNQHCLRGHSLKLFKPRSNTTVRSNFFSHRIIDDWNSLRQHVVDATSVNAFKNRLDQHWADMDIKKR